VYQPNMVFNASSCSYYVSRYHINTRYLVVGETPKLLNATSSSLGYDSRCLIACASEYLPNSGFESAVYTFCKLESAISGLGVSPTSENLYGTPLFFFTTITTTTSGVLWCCCACNRHNHYVSGLLRCLGGDRRRSMSTGTLP
jgi:hypothetical protein